MPIAPVGAAGALPLSITSPVRAPATAGGFGDVVARGIENLQELHATADTLATQAATGQLTDVHDYTIAATKASLATELTVAVRNKAVDAFNEIMRMQI